MQTLFLRRASPASKSRRKGPSWALAHLVESTVLRGGEGPFDSEILKVTKV